MKLSFGTMKAHTKIIKPKDTMYTLCRTNGKIKRAQMKKPPKVLDDLIFGNDAKRKYFLENIHSYDSMFFLRQWEER